MTPTERFTMKAVEGGWKYPLNGRRFNVERYGEEFRVKLTGISVPLQEEVALLDPDLWRCAGKALGWRQVGPGKHENDFEPDAFYAHEGLIKALWDGQTADTYLAGLLTDANGNE